MATDHDRLQGRWRQVRFNEDGIADPPDSHSAEGAITTIWEDRFHVGVPQGETLLEGKFVLNPSANPPQIDWIDSIGADAGKTLPAIYTLADNAFEFAAADAGMARPLDFRSGPGITIRAFVRA